MEATALSVGKSVLSGALGYAKSAIAAEVALQLGVERDQAFISDELEMMQAFLMAAHEERDDNRVVQIWVKQVRDVAYDVEDSLQGGGSGSKPVTLGGHSIISSEVALHMAEAAREALREKKKVDLLKLIAKDDENELKAIAVWGASNDVGVTSIIRAAYEDQLVKHKFKCRAWVRLLHPFSPNDFFASLVRQFHGDQLEQSEKATEGSAVGLEVMKDMATQDNLVDVFNRYVTEMKYLVVVTDVSTVEEWDWIKTYFPSKNGSRIIVSTLQFEVASLCTEQPYTVSEIDQQWSPEKDFYVFYKKVDTPTKKDDMTSEAEISSAEPSAGEQHAKKFTRAGTMVAAAAAAFEDDQLIDRAAAKAEVVRLIALDGEVTAICGMGGLGKTTLARSVYQQELAEKFQRRAWLSISGSFNPNDFQSNLFQQLRNDHQEKADKLRSDAKKKETEQESIPTRLTKILLEQKCLIVLDDVPSTVEWQDIEHQQRRQYQGVASSPPRRFAVLRLPF
uniref:Uncharacterized protein n=1 Tax=Avena sativa TaxID=4498 RepID=A0ACD5YBM2_AVESA